MMDWGFLIQVISIVAVGIGTYAAIRTDIAVMHANLLNTRDDVKELQKDVKRHDREIAGLDRRQHDGTGKFTCGEG
jgi:uncharacterized membrane protein (DUF106 family)